MFPLIALGDDVEIYRRYDRVQFTYVGGCCCFVAVVGGVGVVCSKHRLLHSKLVSLFIESRSCRSMVRMPYPRSQLPQRNNKYMSVEDKLQFSQMATPCRHFLVIKIGFRRRRTLISTNINLWEFTPSIGYSIPTYCGGCDVLGCSYMINEKRRATNDIQLSAFGMTHSGL